MLTLFLVQLAHGSFTGIRIGIATTKAFCMVNQLPAIGVTSLETLAYSVKPSGDIVSLIDAKNDNVYCGIFDNKYHLLQDYVADHIDAIISNLQKHKNICFVGNGALLHRQKLETAIPNSTFSIYYQQSAFCLAQCAYQKYIQQDTLTADTLLPLYLRKSQAERMKG